MGLRYLVLACIVALPLTGGKWSSGPNFSPTRKINLCGRHVEGRRNYLNKRVGVPLGKLADVLLGDEICMSRYKDVFAGTAYQTLSEAFYNESFGGWQMLNSTWAGRSITFERKVYGSYIVDKATLAENHTALYGENVLIFKKSVRNMDGLSSGFYMDIEYCAIEMSEKQIHLEVDINLVIENPLLQLISGNIEEAADLGFVDFYGALDYLLKHLAEEPDSPITLKLQYVNFTLPVPDILMDERESTEFIPDGAEKNSYIKYFIAIAVVIALLAAIFCIYQKVNARRRNPDSPIPLPQSEAERNAEPENLALKSMTPIND